MVRELVGILCGRRFWYGVLRSSGQQGSAVALRPGPKYGCRGAGSGPADAIPPEPVRKKLPGPSRIASPPLLSEVSGSGDGGSGSGGGRAQT